MSFSSARLVSAACLLLPLLPLQPAAAADAARGRELAGACTTCHGRNGVGTNPMVPHIAGQSAQYLVKQLKEFRDGKREDPQMTIIARGLEDGEIADLAAWYASIEFTVTMPDE